MKKSKIKKIIIICGIFLFLVINVWWFFGKLRPYLILQGRMENHPAYRRESGMAVDEDGYTYGTHFPTYLIWRDGNLSISAPLKEVGPAPGEPGKKLYAVSGSGMIIWLNYYTGEIRELGVMLMADNVRRQIYLVDNETARYADDQEVVDNNQSEISKLFMKAEEMWDLEMPWKK